jgi:hypothetical protein
MLLITTMTRMGLVKWWGVIDWIGTYTCPGYCVNQHDHAISLRPSFVILSVSEGSRSPSREILNEVKNDKTRFRATRPGPEGHLMK